MKIKKDLILILILLVGCSAQPNLQATLDRADKNYFIYTTGNDSNSGTIVQPWKTIQKGLITVNARGTLTATGKALVQSDVQKNFFAAVGDASPDKSVNEILPAPGVFNLYLPIIITSSQAQAGNNYFVSTSGNDSNAGTLAQPWRTIQKAAKTMVAGDIVFVRAGTYNNGISLTKSGTASAYITYKAYPGEHPVLSGNNGYGFADYSSAGLSYIGIDGFEIIGGEFGINFSKASSSIFASNNIVHGQTNTGISVNKGANGIIYNNIAYNISGYAGIHGDNITGYSISHNSSYNINQSGIMVSHATTDTLIYGNRVYGNGCGTDQRYAGIAIEISSEHNRVYNNLFYNNCHAGYLTNSSRNEIYNNVFYGNTEYQVLIGDWEGSIPENNIFKNNVFFVTRGADHALGNFHSGTPYDALKNTYNYNAYYYINGPDKSDMVRLDNIYSFAKWKSAGFESKGMLVNPNFIGATNFHLNNNSPLIDVGIDLGPLVPDDFDGVIRPQGAGYDIGAYEVP